MTDDQIDKFLDDIHGNAFPDRLQLTGEQVRARERDLVRAFAADHREPGERERLLAEVAGSVSAGVLSMPTKALTNAGAIAAVSVDIAEEILKKSGL